MSPQIFKVINWLNGLWRCRYRAYERRLCIGHQLLQQMFKDHGVLPREAAADWARHVYRELNVEADEMANRQRDERQVTKDMCRYNCYRAYFDGSVTPTGAGGGWVLYGAQEVLQDEPSAWKRIAAVSFPMPPGSTITQCELEACLWAVGFATALLQSEAEALRNLQTWVPQKITGVKTLLLADLLR